MSDATQEPRRPEPWSRYRARTRYRALVPFFYLDWLAAWATYFLSQWALLKALEYCGTLSILVGVIFYFAGAKDRLEQKHYQAWQVINTAQGKGGSGGRIDALQDLNADRVPLIGVDLADAFLRGVQLPGAKLRRCVLSGADARQAVLRGADLADSDLIYTNLRDADLCNANLGDSVNFTNADLSGANLDGADVEHATLDNADLRNADLANLVHWQSINSIKLANILGVRDPPNGFVAWALRNGAVQLASDHDWNALTSAATKP